MEAVILGRQTAERAHVERLLVDAGTNVRVCRPDAWGCAGLHDACPLDEHDVDVAIAVIEPADRFDTQGLACMHRARVPIVAVGGTSNDPILEFATAHLPRADASFPDAVQAAAVDGSGHRRAVEDALDARRHEDEQVEVRIDRSPRRIGVRLVGRLDADRASVLADAARAAVRSYDQRADVIDVSVLPAAEGGTS